MSRVKQAIILLYGSGCVGKSFSLATLFKLRDIRPNQRVILLCTENNSLPGIEQGIRHYNIKLEPDQFIIVEVKPKQKRAFKAKAAAFRKFASGTKEQVYSSPKDTNANKDKYTYLIDVIDKLESLTGYDYVTNEEVKLGNIAELEEEDVLIVDGLTPIIHGIWNLVQGDKLVNDQNEYQIVQKQVKDITQELVSSITCSLVMLAHEEQDKKGITRPHLNCGQALHGNYIGAYTDTIYAYKTMANKFCWAGKKLNVETGNRNFPASDSLEPDFSKYFFFKDE